MWQLGHKEGWKPKNWCFLTVVLEKMLESPMDCKEIKPDNPKGNQPWIFTGRTDAEAWRSNTSVTWWQEQIHWKRPWCWKRLRAGEEGNRGWDSWMASLTQWTWVLTNSRRQWSTGKPGLLQSTGSQSDMTERLNTKSNWTGTVVYLDKTQHHLDLAHWERGSKSGHFIRYCKWLKSIFPLTSWKFW